MKLSEQLKVEMRKGVFMFVLLPTQLMLVTLSMFVLLPTTHVGDAVYVRVVAYTTHVGDAVYVRLVAYTTDVGDAVYVILGLMLSASRFLALDSPLKNVSFP